VHTAPRDAYSIREVRNYLNAYSAIEQGLSIYIKLLVNQHHLVRADAARVLGSLNSSATSILPVLRDQFSLETSEENQTVLLEAMTRLLKEQDYTGRDLRKSYVPFFYQVIDSPASLWLRFVAAQCALEVLSEGFMQRVRSAEIPASLVTTLIEQYWSTQAGRMGIVQRLALLSDRKPLIDLLQHPGTTPDEAHEIVVGLLSHVVSPHLLRAYFDYLPLRKKNSDITSYAIYNSAWSLNPTKTHIGQSWDLLRTILSADNFWAKPTNLLSFMFNLPDDREDLRAYIEQTQ
jgi:hypothetical protein